MTFKNRLIRAFPVWKQLLRRSKPLVQMSTATGGAAGNITLTGIKADDELCGVVNLADGVDLSSEFSIIGDDTIDNTGGTSTAADRLLVVWLTWDVD